VEKFICREIPVRDNVIVANRRRKTAMPWVGGLNVTDGAPMQDKPVMLAYGGAFNPPHQGHVEALQNAQNALRGAGYNVAGTFVVPTADKLLAGKEMDPAHRLNLQSRANVVKAAFPKDIDGSPVTVHTGPSEEIETAMGKPRRTDLARWIQQRYPDHTVVNVTGEDALVPGAPDQHPSIYSGAPGSNHEGFAYLTMPRDPDESMSSSKIRAALASGQPLPGMTPNSERAYRDELGKLRASFEHTARKNYRQAKDGGCTCWEGYERVPGTKPCADGSCRKKSAEKVKRHKLTDPGPLGNGKDDKMPSISEELGEDWHKRGPGGKYARENRRSR
jgi:nicotinic acid mononucleotide adenylyltransferase